MPHDTLLGAIVRRNEVIIPHGDDVLQPNDHVLIIALKKAVPELDELLESKDVTNPLQKFFKKATTGMFAHPEAAADSLSF
ncbi:MAG: TrkA C-terminal domain-containing protein [Candidatus Hinthialibacter sp.]